MAGDQEKENRPQQGDENKQEKPKKKEEKKKEERPPKGDKLGTDIVFPNLETPVDENEPPTGEGAEKSTPRDDSFGNMPMGPMMPMQAMQAMQPWGFMNFMPWMSPAGGLCPPMMGGTPSEQYEEEEEDSVAQEVPVLQLSEEELEEGEKDEENPLAKYQEKYTTKEGEPVSRDVQDFMNKMWARGKDPEVMKTCYTTYGKPGNVNIPRVELNNEVKSGKNGPPKDAKLKSIQIGLNWADAGDCAVYEAP
jgi:hypothetical protein